MKFYLNNFINTQAYSDSIIYQLHKLTTQLLGILIPNDQPQIWGSILTHLFGRLTIVYNVNRTCDLGLVSVQETFMVWKQYGNAWETSGNPFEEISCMETSRKCCPTWKGNFGLWRHFFSSIRQRRHQYLETFKKIIKQ